MDRKLFIPGTIIFLAVVVAVLLELRPGSEEPAPVALIRTDNNGAAGGPLEQSEAGVPAKSAERDRPEPSKGWLLAEGIERHFPASSVLVTKATHRLVEKDSFGRTVEEWEIHSYCHDNSLDRFTEINTREGIVEFFATLHQEIQSPDMVIGQIGAMDIIPDTGAIRGAVVITENSDGWALVCCSI